ncbi:hypothetical protein pipiens_004787, partial [Culex pipiens pipiens]
MSEVVRRRPSSSWWQVQVLNRVLLWIDALTFLIMGAIGYMVNTVFGAMFTNGTETSTVGLLYPVESETREAKKLDGMWNFVRSDSSNPSQGLREKWFSDDLAKFRPTIGMPVPSSYNDVTEDASIRDHVGTVWYDRRFFVPKSWQLQRVFVRFGSVHYDSVVWINGQQVLKHEFGHLPFEADISQVLEYGKENRITVLCDNVLLQVTIPQGKIVNSPVDGGVELVQTYTFDFFNYAGIHRSVELYTVPQVFIRDVVVNTDLVGDEGHIYYTVESSLNSSIAADLQATVKILDKAGTVVGVDTATGAELKGVVIVKNVKPWWPYLMHEEYGYMYSMEVTLEGKSNEASEPVGEIFDVYRMKVGVRTLEWNNTSFLINGQPIYFRGFGRHEDSDIRGKGLDYALLTKDFNLLKWVGANAYRTSHYPYSEESMQFADEHGIMIIDECPSVDTENYSQILLEKHKASIEQLIHRDRNHPSVVMWSIANEPRTGQFAADAYFEAVAKYTRALDPSRPVTAAIAVGVNDDRAMCTLCVYPCFLGWVYGRRRLRESAKKFVDVCCVCGLVIYQMTFVAVTVKAILLLDLSPVSSLSILLEMTRFVLKIHAFVRSSVPEVLKENAIIPTFRQFVYFLFAPTLIYRNEYPRTETIRWRIVLNHTLEIIALLYMFYIYSGSSPLFNQTGIIPSSTGSTVHKLFLCILPANYYFIYFIYASMHSWHNAWAELLRFGDRLFYRDWWNATSFAAYVRAHNAIVHNFLYTYVYKDFYDKVWQSKKEAASVVFLISALVNEAILLRFFYPVLMGQFLFMGLLIANVEFGNVLVLALLSVGHAIETSQYSTEYYARRNCPELLLGNRTGVVVTEGSGSGFMDLRC